MCTLSWIPGLDGHVLMVNRDERRTRPAALPPSLRIVEGVATLAPTDPEGGGTWVAVNSAGVTLGLANRYHDTLPAERAHRVSRGRLVTALASSSGLEEIEARLAEEGLERFDGFTLVALEPGSPARPTRRAARRTEAPRGSSSQAPPPMSAPRWRRDRPSSRHFPPPRAGPGGRSAGRTARTTRCRAPFRSACIVTKLRP